MPKTAPKPVKAKRLVTRGRRICWRTALSATTDNKGAFQIDSVPPGRIDLFIDGRTVNPSNDPARAQYPSLHFEAYAVKGQINQLAHPVYLPPLLTGSAKTVGGNADVILTIPGLEGFQMKVKANSVTFPDGSRVGTLVVSPVTADKLPMAPPAGGAKFGVPAWTIQPAGTRFDPPIELQLPNSTGEIPGDNLPVVQWDHDLSQYVPMGRATVSSDGAFLVTDAGSGLTKAGWGGICRYDPCKVALSEKCPDCKRIITDACPTCSVYDSTNIESVEVSRPFQFVVNSWGPSKALSEIVKAALGAEVGLELSVVGQKTDKAECCSDVEGKTNILMGQVGVQGETFIDFNINGVSPIGRALYYAGLRASIKGKVGAQLAATVELHDCPFIKDNKPELQNQWNGQGQINSGIELNIKIGQLSTPVGNLTVIGFEGAGGLEVVGLISSNREPNQPNFNIDTYLNFYVQGDVVLLNQKVTGVRLQVPLTRNDKAPVRLLFP
jgi:hypothetical protein